MLITDECESTSKLKRTVRTVLSSENVITNTGGIELNSIFEITETITTTVTEKI